MSPRAAAATSGRGYRPSLHWAAVADLSVEGDELVFHMGALEKAEAVHGDIRVPLSAVTTVRVVDDPWGELRGMRAQLEAADARMVEENEQPCCYAKSDKYWVTDPTGIAWETFHTLGRIPVSCCAK